jgi:hypothetical protein
MKNPMLVQRIQRSMYESISIIRGLDKTTQDILLHAGIKYTHQLLVQGRTEQQRMELARQTGIPLSTITMLITRTDLMRLRGVGGDLSQLLEQSGVSSCRALQDYVPEKLYKRLAETHIRHRIAYHAPTLAQVRSWINEAKHLAETSPS